MSPPDPAFGAEIGVRSHRDVAILQVTGELDLANSATVVGRLTQGVPDAAHAVVLDLSELEFMDSTAIRGLFGFVTRLVEQRLRVVVVAEPDTAVARVLDLVRFGHAADVLDSLDDALATLATVARSRT